MVNTIEAALEKAGENLEIRAAVFAVLAEAEKHINGRKDATDVFRKEYYADGTTSTVKAVNFEYDFAVLIRRCYDANPAFKNKHQVRSRLWRTSIAGLH
jgi:hypothetical protein